MDEPLTLVDFLLARIAEDWEAAGDCPRALAECEAKRRMVAAAKRSVRTGAFVVWWDVLQLLALPYADHADYRADWRP